MTQKDKKSNMESQEIQPQNPLTEAQKLLIEMELEVEFETPEELTTEIATGWCDYRLFFVWQEDFLSLQFCTQMGIFVPEEHESTMNELFQMVNERIWLGSFSLCSIEKTPMFRYTLLLGGTKGASKTQLEDILEVGLSECDRIYPALEFILADNKTAKEAFDNALMETVGEA